LRERGGYCHSFGTSARRNFKLMSVSRRHFWIAANSGKP